MRKKTFRFWLALFFLSPALGQSDQNPPGSRTNPPPGQQQQQLPSTQEQLRRQRKISGRVLPAQGEYRLPSLVTVTAVSLSGGYRQTAMVRGDGSFELRDSPAGTLTLIVESPDYEPSEQMVNVDDSLMGAAHYFMLSMGKRLEEEGDKVPVNPQDKTVSAADMAVPKEALKEMEKAFRESQNKKPEKAIEHLQKALKIYPNLYQAYNNLAAQYIRLGRPQEAIEALEKSISLHPENATAFRNLGLIYLNQREYPKALQVLRKSVEFDPHDHQAQMFLGECYFGLRQYVLAATSFQNAVRINPEHQLAYLRIGHCYVELQQVPEAVRQFELFLAAEPKGQRAEEVRRLMSQLARH